MGEFETELSIKHPHFHMPKNDFYNVLVTKRFFAGQRKLDTMLKCKLKIEMSLLNNRKPMSFRPYKSKDCVSLLGKLQRIELLEE